MERITIDKTIEIFEGIKKGICPWYPELYYDKAINTMRKYQKIEEIVKFGNANELGFEYVGEKITEVMEDA